MRIGQGINQLGGDAYLLARSLNASSQHIAHAELAADPPGGDWLVPVGQRGIARGHEHAVESRKIGRQILGDAVDKVLLIGVVLAQRRKPRGWDEI